MSSPSFQCLSAHFHGGCEPCGGFWPPEPLLDLICFGHCTEMNGAMGTERSSCGMQPEGTVAFKDRVSFSEGV